MSPQEQIEKLQQQILHQQALSLAQAAEIAALRAVLRTLDTALRAVLPPSQRPGFDEAFLAQRQAHLQQLLLQQQDKALAARLSDQLERSDLHFPLSWD